MFAYESDSKLLREILGLERSPVGVKFFAEVPQDAPWFKDYVADEKMHYCQALMQASHGQKLAISEDVLNCAPAQAGFGFRPLHPKVASGAAHVNAGVFGVESAAQKVFAEMPRMELGSCQYVLLAPLEAVDFTPDVVVLEAEPEQIMWLVLSSLHTSGERANFSTAVAQAACVDSTIIPHLKQELNISLGCVGCRSSSDIKTTEMFVGIPWSKFATVKENLQKINTKLIPQNREKLAYQRFADNK